VMAEEAAAAEAMRVMAAETARVVAEEAAAVVAARAAVLEATAAEAARRAAQEVERSVLEGQAAAAGVIATRPSAQAMTAAASFAVAEGPPARGYAGRLSFRGDARGSALVGAAGDGTDSLWEREWESAWGCARLKVRDSAEPLRAWPHDEICATAARLVQRVARGAGPRRALGSIRQTSLLLLAGRRWALILTIQARAAAARQGTHAPQPAAACAGLGLAAPELILAQLARKHDQLLWQSQRDLLAKASRLAPAHAASARRLLGASSRLAATLLLQRRRRFVLLARQTGGELQPSAFTLHPPVPTLHTPASILPPPDSTVPATVAPPLAAPCPPSLSTAIVLRAPDIDSRASAGAHAPPAPVCGRVPALSVDMPHYPTGETEACTAAWVSWWRRPMAPPKRQLQLEHVFYSEDDELALRRMAGMPSAPAAHEQTPRHTAMVRD